MKSEIPSALAKWVNIIEVTTDWQHIFKIPHMSASEILLQIWSLELFIDFFLAKTWLYDKSKVTFK